MDLCEGCFARDSIGTFDVGDIETPLCAGCSTFWQQEDDGVWRVVIPNEAV